MNGLAAEATLNAIAEAATTGFTAVLRKFLSEHPDEVLYSFGPYIPYDVGYVGSVIFTESGLAQVADRYEQGGHGTKPQLLDELRWSPADSPFVDYGTELLADVDALLSGHRDSDDATHTGSEDESEDHWEARVEARATALVDGLQAVDFEGLLDGRLSDVVLCVWGGDQSDEDRVAFVRTLNQPEVVDRFLISYGFDAPSA